MGIKHCLLSLRLRVFVVAVFVLMSLCVCVPACACASPQLKITFPSVAATYDGLNHVAVAKVGKASAKVRYTLKTVKNTGQAEKYWSQARRSPYKLKQPGQIKVYAIAKCKVEGKTEYVYAKASISIKPAPYAVQNVTIDYDKYEHSLAESNTALYEHSKELVDIYCSQSAPLTSKNLSARIQSGQAYKAECLRDEVATITRTEAGSSPLYWIIVPKGMVSAAPKTCQTGSATLTITTQNLETCTSTYESDAMGNCTVSVVLPNGEAADARDYEYVWNDQRSALVITGINNLAGSVDVQPTYMTLRASYSQTTTTLNNPERGFYRTAYLSCSGSYAENSSSNKLMHVRANLGAFSNNAIRQHPQRYGYTQSDAEQLAVDGYSSLSQKYLDGLQSAFDKLRKQKQTCIIRFSYDDFMGWSDCEPSIEGMVSHIQQLIPVINKNKDVVLSVDAGLIGPCGEQRASAIMSEQSIKAICDAFLDGLDDELCVTVRRPRWYCYVAGITLEELQAGAKASKDSKYYRLGIFNDGYLGSDSDLGTFSDRQKEIAWLNYQAGHTPYGGEIMYNPNGSTVSSSIDYISQEMFITHTCYLNYEHNINTVEDEWQKEVYQGSDTAYQGLSAYKYINDHLGYRYVLTGSYCGLSSTGKTILKLDLENVGAGNMIKSKTTTLVLVPTSGSKQSIVVTTDIDARTWESTQTSTEYIELPSTATAGEYKAYLRIQDANGNQVQFANNNEFGTYGNYVGTVQLLTQGGGRRG